MKKHFKTKQIQLYYSTKYKIGLIFKYETRYYEVLYVWLMDNPQSISAIRKTFVEGF